jgi:AcrR family transcriptional regulator
MTAVVEDRRVRRTRRLLREALLELILEKGYDALTVQDVLDRADVGRATFYAHFHDKDELLVSGAEDIRESLRRKMAGFIAGRGTAEPDGFDVTRVLFEHAAAHRRLYRALMGKRGGGVIYRHAHQDLTTLFREHFEDAIAVRQLTPALPVEVVVQYVVSGLLALLTWWLDNDLPYTAEEMNHMLQRLSRSGVLGVIGAPHA